MRNFRGPLPRCQGSDDSSDEGEEDDIDFIYLNHQLVFSDDSDLSDEFNETDRFAFNLVFNRNNQDSSDEDEEELAEESDHDDDNVNDDSGNVPIQPEGGTGVEEVAVEEDPSASASNQDYLIALEIDSINGGIGCRLVDRRNMEGDERIKGVVLPGSSSESPTQVIHVENGGTSSVNLEEDVDMSRNSAEDETPEVASQLRNLDGHDSDDSYHQFPDKSEQERCESAGATESDEGREEEQFCNPMASDSDDGDDQNENLLRGDRIGSTTYSERHVLKILLNWIEKLPTFDRSVNDEEGAEDVDKPLEENFEEAMSLLWDMSAETDVIHFVMGHSILTLIRDTMDTLKCPTRLKEIALGILANILSCPSILEEFPEKDEEFHLVDRIVMNALSCTKIPLLIQVFAVLRRVVCYIRNGKPIERWMNFLLHEEFIAASNFLLASSTNGILLGDVVMTMFTLMEVLAPPHDSEESTEEEKQTLDATLTENFKPFCNSEFVPSLCEGLNELLKDSRSISKSLNVNRPTDPTKLPQCHTTGHGPDDFEDDVAPPGHIQSAVLNGIGALAYLQKFEVGRTVLRRHSKTLISVLVTILDKFKFCTERVESPEMLDYFALAVELLGFCHVGSEEKLEAEQVLVPASASMWLIEEAAREKQTHIVNFGTESTSVDIELDSSKVSPYAIIFFNYLISLKETFGDHTVEEIMTGGKDKYKKFYQHVLQIVHQFQSEDTNNTTKPENTSVMT